MESSLDLGFLPVQYLPLKSPCSKNLQNQSLPFVHFERKSKLMAPACGNTQDHLLKEYLRRLRLSTTHMASSVLWREPILKRILLNFGSLTRYPHIPLSVKSLIHCEYVGRLCNKKKSPFYIKLSLLATVLTTVKRHRDVCGKKSSVPTGRNVFWTDSGCAKQRHEARYQYSRDGFQ